jgi:hypothetical protein
MAAAVTESLPNLKKNSTAKRVTSMGARIYAASKAFGHQKPCVVMKRTDSIRPVQLRSATEEFRGWVKHRFLQ